MAPLPTKSTYFMMMSGPEWLKFQHTLMTVFVILSIVINAILMILIFLKSPKNLGPYKHLMQFISVFEVAYAVVDYLVLPVMQSHKASFFTLSVAQNSIFDKFGALIMLGIWCGFFGASMAIFGIHFVYRYLAVTGNKYISTFQGSKIFLWLSIPFVFGGIWGLVAYFCCGPKDVLTESIKEDLMISFELSADDVVYVGPYFYDPQGHFVADTDSLTTLIGASLIMGTSLCTIFYFGYKCYIALTTVNAQTAQSQNFRTLQKQFFTALVLQTIIPITLMHFPLSFNYASALLNYGLGKISNLATITIGLYPVIDPLPTIFIVKNYRAGLKQFCVYPWRMIRKVAKVNTETNGTNNTRRTSKLTNECVDDGRML